MPEEVTFATKPELARRMLERTLDVGLPVAWVIGDTVYGSAQLLRAALETRKQAYALAVTCKEYVEVQGTRRRVDRVARDLAREDWQVLSAGAGSKGPRLFAWARIELAAPDATDTVQSQVPSNLPAMVPLSVAEIRRLLSRLVAQQSLSFAYRLAWSY